MGKSSLISKQVRLAVGILGMGAGVSCIIALIQGNGALARDNVIALGILGTLFFCGASVIFKWHKAPFSIGTPVKTVIIFGFWAVVMTSFCSYEWPKDKPDYVTPVPAPTNLGIFMKCDMTNMPVTIPAKASIRIVPINEAFMRATPKGSYEFRNDDTKERTWPERSKLAERKKTNDSGDLIYRCDISNHSTLNVLDVAIPMRFWFSGRGGDANAVNFTPIVSPLDAGRTAVIYFVNDCPDYAMAVLPKTVTVQVVGEFARRSTPLALPRRDLTDPIMMWFGTKIRWVNNTSCRPS